MQKDRRQNMKWEYRFETVDSSGAYLADEGERGWIEDNSKKYPQWVSVDALGKEGWELVSISGWEASEAIAVFKRPCGLE